MTNDQVSLEPEADAEPWPRWMPKLRFWDHTGCENHDLSWGDRDACRRLNRKRQPAPATPEWRELKHMAETVHDEMGPARAEFLEAFSLCLVNERETALAEEWEFSDGEMSVHQAIQGVISNLLVIHSRASLESGLVDSSFEMLRVMAIGLATELKRDEE